jgi:hypothetical protein
MDFMSSGQADPGMKAHIRPYVHSARSVVYAVTAAAAAAKYKEDNNNPPAAIVVSEHFDHSFSIDSGLFPPWLHNDS